MNKLLFILLSLLSLVLFSCQNEEQTITQNTKESITKSSSLATLITRVTQYPTELDNCLDNTSCISIQLPVSIYLNSQSLVINSKTDYITVENIKNAYNTDNDIVYFTFPITIVYKNFKQKIVYSQTELESSITSCIIGEQFPEIECIDFNYPIALNSYNSDTQISNTISITNDSQLYNFIDSLKENTINSFVYPFSLTNATGQNIVVNNNSDLKIAIENSIGTCDDVIIGPGNELSDIIINGSWFVSYFLDESVDQTAYYNGYNFSFNANGTVIATKNAASINGTWSIITDDNVKKLIMNFDGEVLKELEDDWKVLEFNTLKIRLEHISGGDGDVHYLNFSKN